MAEALEVTRARFDPKIGAMLILPFLGVALPSVYQDFLPGYTAATLLRRGEVSPVYLAPEASDLFEVPETFARVAQSAAAPLGEVRRESVTAFVAPPPALLLALPFTYLPYAWAARLWALGQAALASVSLWLVHRYLDRPAHFPSFALAFAPAAALVVHAGQSSCFLLATACAFALPRGRAADACLAAVASAAIVFKVWPAFALFGLLWIGRFRAAAASLGLVVALTLATLVVFPPDLFHAFGEASVAIARRVIPDANNLSVESLLVRADAGASSFLLRPSPWIGAAAAAVRVAAAGIFAGAFFLRRPSRELVWSAAWTLVLLCLPLLWNHYLVIAPALLAPVLAAPALGPRHRLWTFVTLSSVGLYMVTPRYEPPWLGAVLLLNLVACVLAACWLKDGAPAVNACPPAATST